MLTGSSCYIHREERKKCHNWVNKLLGRTIRSHLMPVRMAAINKSAKTSVDEDAEKREP